MSLNASLPQRTEARRELARRELARRRLSAWCEYGPPTARGPMRLSAWQRHLCAELDAVMAQAASRQAPRLIVCAPPQHGKSELVSRRMPVAYGARYGGTVAVCSYGDSLAVEHSRAAREMARGSEALAVWPHLRMERRVAEAGGYSRNDIDRLDDWSLGQAEGRPPGRYLSRGVGQGLTGRTVQLLVVDDPFRDEAEASSQRQRDAVWSWYASVVIPRAAATRAGIVVMHTRWHEDDLVGRLLAAERKGGDAWRVVSYPALAEADDILGREVGAALDPELMTPEQLEQTRRVIGPRRFAALYQQRPSPAEGSELSRAWLGHRYEGDPMLVRRTMDRVVLAADTAFRAKQSSDPSAFVVVGVKGAMHYVLHVTCDRIDYPTQRTTLRDLAARWQPDAVLVEGKATGDPLVADLRTLVRGIQTVEPGQLDKVARMRPYHGLWSAGQVLLPASAPWVADYVEEMCSVPSSAHDDQWDATAYALRWLAAPAVLGSFRHKLGV